MGGATFSKSILFFLLLSLFLTGVSANEQPSLQPPHQYFGSVTVNGQPAQDGLLVTAKINSVDVGATTTNGGRFGYFPIFTVADPSGDRNGRSVEFFVQGVSTGQSLTFSNEGDSARTQIDLTVDDPRFSTSTSTNSNSGSSGGGGGGGGSGRYYQNQEEQDADQQGSASGSACNPEWVCSDWLECVSGSQRRVCVDANRCDQESGKPLEQQGCEVPQELRVASGQQEVAAGQEESAKGLGVTGMVVAATNFATSGTGVALGILILIVVVGILILYKRSSARPPF